MHLTALVKTADHVCCRYRLAAYRPYLEEAGYRLELQPFPVGWLSGLRLRRALGRPDAVIVQRRFLSANELAQVRRVTGRVIYDFDDAVFLRDSYAARGPHSEWRQQGFVHMVRAADAVVAGNAFLADQAALWTDPRRVAIIRTCVDPRRYPRARHERRGPATQLVWIGSASTLRGLERVRPMLEQLGERLPGMSLKIICDRSLALDRLTVCFCPWSEATEAVELAAADIGISWLPDDRWSQGKCGLKLLQYMAAGLPVVANPVGVQAELLGGAAAGLCDEKGDRTFGPCGKTAFLRRGEVLSPFSSQSPLAGAAQSGFLANTPEQWLAAVQRLADEPALRQTMGQAGRRRVEQDYSVSHGAAQWLELLERLFACEGVAT